MNNKESDIIDWLVNNGARINPIILDFQKSKEKLMEMEPVVFHEDIEKEFQELVMQNITDLITKDLAISAELVYNTIEDKKLLINVLNRNLN